MTLALVLVCAIAGSAPAQNHVPAAPSPVATPADTQALDTTGVKPPASTPETGSQLDVPAPGAHDRSVLGSPVPASRSGITVPVGTVLHVAVTDAISSGTALNGAPVHAVLQTAVRTQGGAVLPAGTRVLGTVVSSARAGIIGSGGVLSIQLTHVGPAAVITDVRDFNGQQGHKDVADSAPEKGSEAIVAAGAPLEFHVMETGNVPGVLPGIAPAANAGGRSGGAATSGVRDNASPGAGQGATPGSSATGSTGQNVAPGQQPAPGSSGGTPAPAAASPTGAPK